MEREVSISLFAVIILIAAVFTISYIGVKPTGFAIFQQQTQTDFSSGTYLNTTYNGTSIILANNQTSGYYISGVLNAGNASTLNNITLTGSGNMTIEAKGCYSSDCSDSNFTTVNLNNINLTGQYFQYEAFFTANSSSQSLSGVTLSYTQISNSTNQTNQTIQTSVVISDPSGTKNSTSNIPILFNAVGTNLSCYYNVQNSSGSIVVSNTTLTGCGNSTFNVNNADSYTFNLYVLGAGGNISQSSAFLIVLPSQTNTTTQQTQNQTQTPQQNQTTPTLIPVQQQTVGASISDIPQQNLNEDATGSVSVNVQNTGTSNLTNCVLASDSPDWAAVSTGSQEIDGGATASYTISTSAPLNADIGTHNIGLTLTCSEATATKTLTINVIKTQIGFNLKSINRVSSGRVKVEYSIAELANETQNVTITLDLLDSSSNIVSNFSQAVNLSAGDIKSFTANLPINSSAPLFQNESENVSLTLKTDYSSSIYSGEYLKTIVLTPPTGGFLSGFAILGEGSGSIVAGVIVLLLIVVVFFVLRKAMKSRRK